MIIAISSFKANITFLFSAFDIICFQFYFDNGYMYVGHNRMDRFQVE